MAIELVCSIEAGTAGEWQAALLGYSRDLSGDQNRLTVLCAGAAPTEDINADIFVVPNSRHADGGDYAPLNKPYSLAYWLDSNPNTEAVICILDADMVLFAPLPAMNVYPGCMVSQAFPADIAVSLSDRTVRNLTAHPELLAGAGVPHWVTRSDLEAVVPRWIEQTERLRRFGSAPFAWVVEMLGFQLAVADCGISQRVVDIACGPDLLHYYRGACGMHWYKGDYAPWEPVLAGPSEPAVVRRFLEVLNDLALLRRG